MELRKFKNAKEALLSCQGGYGSDFDSYDDIIDYCGCKLPNNGGYHQLTYENIRIFDDERFERFCKIILIDNAWCVCKKLAIKPKCISDYRFILVSKKNNCVYVNSDFDYKDDYEKSISELKSISNYDEIVSSYKVYEKQLEMYNLVKNKETDDIYSIYAEIYKELANKIIRKFDYESNVE